MGAGLVLILCSFVQALPRAQSAPTAASTNLEAQAIEASNISGAMDPVAERRLLIKVETLLDRAHFSPGEIDGRGGANLKNAIDAFEQAHGLADGGKVDAEFFRALTADSGPVTQDYVINAEDEKGPFLGTVPTGFPEMAKLKYLGHANPLESLAEKFHLSEKLLRELNPKADFAAVGTSIVAVRPGDGDIGEPVARVEVDKNTDQVRAIDSTGRIVAAFPATVGSTERPAPSGEWAVKSVAANPTYVYDPRRLTFGDKSKGVLTIAAGPNNPVGSTWIALTRETYGIHGSPNPSRIGKTESHGCVRLTNWDAAALARAVRRGTPVVFVGRTKKA
jgi:lipoprotein-anchoring transpeptidase ErfK/SrfK